MIFLYRTWSRSCYYSWTKNRSHSGCTVQVIEFWEGFREKECQMDWKSASENKSLVWEWEKERDRKKVRERDRKKYERVQNFLQTLYILHIEHRTWTHFYLLDIILYFYILLSLTILFYFIIFLYNFFLNRFWRFDNVNKL